MPCVRWRHLVRLSRRPLHRHARRGLALAAALLGLAVLLAALPAWIWVAAAGVALLVWGLLELAS